MQNARGLAIGWLLCLSTASWGAAQDGARGDVPERATSLPPSESWRPEPPAELYDVVKVVDGDTVHVQRGDAVEKLRLLSVDTEEKLSGRSFSPDKPETIYGQETTLWAQEFIGALSTGDGPPQLGLLFPEGEELRDVYGRLLCHVLLPDGTDFNLLLVRTGRSPYFNKYGNSRLCHAAFVDAQARARAERLGVWNPATNTPAEADLPAVRRPYDRLLPWWECRAQAIDGYRARRAETPHAVAATEFPDELEVLAARDPQAGAADAFGAIYRTFEEDDGSLTLLMRGDSKRALRVRVPPEHREALAPLELAARSESYRQNYLWARGVVQARGRSFELRLRSAQDLRLAGPEPTAPSGD